MSFRCVALGEDRFSARGDGVRRSDVKICDARHLCPGSGTMPSAAKSTMRARFRRRRSIYDERAKPLKLSALHYR
jgi:hypothetical protein